MDDKYIYSYEIRVAEPNCSCPYSWDVWTPGGVRITRHKFGIYLNEIVKEATEVAKRHLEGQEGHVVQRGTIDLTPKPAPEPAPEQRWWKRIAKGD